MNSSQSDSHLSSESVLIRRLSEGDKDDALARLFSQHRERLGRIATFRLDRRMAGRVDAEDILQETYLNAAQRLHHFVEGPGGSFFIWLRMILEQTLIDVHRRHLGAECRDAGREARLKKFSSDSTSASLSFHLLAKMPSPSDAAMRRELNEHLHAALDQMNEIDREVVAMRHFEELTNGEVAEALQISTKAASIRYIRALRRLKDVLKRIPEFALWTPMDASNRPSDDDDSAAEV